MDDRNDSGEPPRSAGVTVTAAPDTAAGAIDSANANRAAAPTTSPSLSTPRAAIKIPTVIFFGTSLTAGYGLSPDQAFPTLVEKTAANAGIPIRSINAGLSGETSAGALRRIDWVLNTSADIIMIETGANDALRGLSVDAARANIEQTVQKAKSAQPGARVILLQMLAPPNLGRAYTESFQDIYPEIARKERVMLVPFFLEGVAGRPDLNQPDGVHPNATGERIVAENVWRALKPVIAAVTGQKR